MLPEPFQLDVVDKPLHVTVSIGIAVSDSVANQVLDNVTSIIAGPGLALTNAGENTIRGNDGDDQLHGGLVLAGKPEPANW